jgi:hypothetical protein
MSDEQVKPEPGPVGYAVVRVSRLKSLGLPKQCVGGQIVADDPLDDGARFCVYEHGGGRYGFAYEDGPRPFGDATSIELTLMDAYDDGTYQQVAA